MWLTLGKIRISIPACHAKNQGLILRREGNIFFYNAFKKSFID